MSHSSWKGEGSLNCGLSSNIYSVFSFDDTKTSEENVEGRSNT